MTRSWLRHPPSTVRPPLVCPTGLPRYATRALAWLPAGLHTQQTPRQCTACDGGWHLTTEGENR